MSTLELPDFENIGEPDDRGWLTEWEILETFTHRDGEQVQIPFMTFAAHQDDAAITARLHFWHRVHHRPIGHG